MIFLASTLRLWCSSFTSLVEKLIEQPNYENFISLIKIALEKGINSEGNA